MENRQRHDRIFAIVLIIAVQAIMLVLLSAAGASTETLLSKAQVGDRVRLSGKLSCNLGAENKGEPCVLLFADSASGRILRLTSEAAAMRAYFDGLNPITIEGMLVKYDTLELARVDRTPWSAGSRPPSIAP